MNPETEICIIAAMAGESRVIGKDGQIPWRISADLNHFRELTTPHPVIMGRKTWDSLNAKFKPLPNRSNIIVSRSFLISETPPTLYVASRLYDAIDLGRSLDPERVFIMGGGEIYTQSVHLADRLFLTLVEGDFPGDTFFPDYSGFRNVVSEEQHETEKGLKYKFVELTR